MYDKAHAITSSTARLGRMDPFIVLKHSLKFQFRKFLWLWLLSNDVDNMVIKRVHSQAYCKSVEEHMQLSFLIKSIFKKYVAILRLFFIAFIALWTIIPSVVKLLIYSLNEKFHKCARVKKNWALNFYVHYFFY